MPMAHIVSELERTTAKGTPTDADGIDMSWLLDPQHAPDPRDIDDLTDEELLVERGYEYVGEMSAGRVQELAEEERAR